ncbi:MAG: glycosyltransferase, partial [Acidobacteriota bacterium]
LELRFVEQIPEVAVRHIPRVLYHWRAIKGSVALSGGEKPYAHERARTAIREHLQRTGSRAEVTAAIYDLHRIRFDLPVEPPKVSLIFIDDGSVDLVHRIDEIIRNTGYPNIEIFGVTNTTRDPGDAHTRWIEQKALSRAEAFNLAASASVGELLCFADPNFRPLSTNWLDDMVGWALREKIGAVGAKLLYKNWTVMHGGLLTGVENDLGIAHHGVGRGALGNMFRNLFPGNFSATSACFMVVEKTKFEAMDGFDAESLPEHLFDVDLCLRMRNAGMRVVVTPVAELIQTTNTTPAILTEIPSATEISSFAKKWPEHLLSDPFYNPNLSHARGDFSIDI